MKKQLLVLSALSIGTVLLVGCQGGGSADPEGAAAPTFSAVSAILTKNCVSCHTGEKAKEGIDLNSYASVMKGGRPGPIVMAGEPANSVIIMAMRGQGKDQMPPGGKLPEDQIKVVEDWIKGGAKE